MIHSNRSFHHSVYARIARRIGFCCLLLFVTGSMLSLSGSEKSSEREDWQLAEGHFYPAVMPMELVYPRPDTETQAHARHRWAHPDVLYRIPACVVQGGAWPFRYELIEGPESAQLGQDRASGSEYGVISWRPSAAEQGKTISFAVRATDQEGKTVVARWSVTVDASKFLFLAPNGKPENPGTIDQPMRDVADWYLGDSKDDSFADRLVYFRAGNYQPIGQAGNENLRMEAGKKPMTFMAFPDEQAVLDASRACWTFWGGVDDVYFSGLEFIGSKLVNPNGSQVKNARNISFYGESNQKRICFFEVTAKGIQPGAVGNDNPAFVWRPSSRTKRGRYWSFVANTFMNGGPKTGNGPSAVSLSCITYIVYERNTVINWDGTGTLYDKANDDYISYRNNDLWRVSSESGQPSRALGAGLSNSYDKGHKPGYIEICYNRIAIKSGNPKRNYAISAAVGAVKGGERGPVWVYRNSILGTIDFVAEKQFNAVFDQNIVQGPSNRSAGKVIEAGDNLWIQDPDAKVFDQDGELLESYRKEHLGRRGAEIKE